MGWMYIHTHTYKQTSIYTHIYLNMEHAFPNLCIYKLCINLNSLRILALDLSEAWGLLKEIDSSSGAAGHYRKGGSPMRWQVFREEVGKGLNQSLIAECLTGEEAYALCKSW